MAKTSFITSGNLNSNCRWKYKIDGLFIESESIQDNCLNPYFFLQGKQYITFVTRVVMPRHHIDYIVTNIKHSTFVVFVVDECSELEHIVKLKCECLTLEGVCKLKHQNTLHSKMAENTLLFCLIVNWPLLPRSQLQNSKEYLS